MTPPQLRAMVATMRELGVIECDGIRLGPVPVAAAPTKRKTLADKERDELDRKGERLKTMLRSSGTRVSSEMLEKMKGIL